MTSVVVLKDRVLDNGLKTKDLIGFYLSERRLNEDEMIGWLRQRLPDYLVPCRLSHINQLPLTINGRIDFSTSRPIMIMIIFSAI
jgi:hypothetical protein